MDELINKINPLIVLLGAIGPIIGGVVYAIRVMSKDSFERYYNTYGKRLVENISRNLIIAIGFASFCILYSFLINELLNYLPKKANQNIIRWDFIIFLLTILFSMISYIVFCVYQSFKANIQKSKKNWIRKLSKVIKILTNVLYINLTLSFFSLIPISSHILNGIIKDKESIGSSNIGNILGIFVVFFAFYYLYSWISKNNRKQDYLISFGNNVTDLNGLKFQYILRDGSLVLKRDSTSNEIFIYDKSNNQYIKFKKNKNH